MQKDAKTTGTALVGIFSATKDGKTQSTEQCELVKQEKSILMRVENLYTKTIFGDMKSLKMTVTKCRTELDKPERIWSEISNQIAAVVNQLKQMIPKQKKSKSVGANEKHNLIKPILKSFEGLKLQVEAKTRNQKQQKR